MDKLRPFLVCTPIRIINWTLGNNVEILEVWGIIGLIFEGINNKNKLINNKNIIS